MLIRLKHACLCGFNKVVLVSAGTDIMVLALFHWATLHELGVQELWLLTGVGDTTRLLPVHVIHIKIGQNVCSFLAAIHALSGSDYKSKFDTKKAVLNSASLPYLEHFVVTSDWDDIK